MQEYWVNVYDIPLEGIEVAYPGHPTKEQAVFHSNNSPFKCIYRIHVKMKPPQVAGRFQRPGPLPKYERGPIEGWME